MNAPVMLMVLAVFVLILAMLVNAQTRKYLCELEEYLDLWMKSEEYHDELRREGTE